MHCSIDVHNHPCEPMTLRQVFMLSCPVITSVLRVKMFFEGGRMFFFGHTCNYLYMRQHL